MTASFFVFWAPKTFGLMGQHQHMQIQQTDAIFLFRKLYLRTDVNNILSSRKILLDAINSTIDHHLDIQSLGDTLVDSLVNLWTTPQHQSTSHIGNILFIIWLQSAIGNVLFISCKLNGKIDLIAPINHILNHLMISLNHAWTSHVHFILF